MRSVFQAFMLVPAEQAGSFRRVGLAEFLNSSKTDTLDWQGGEFKIIWKCVPRPRIRITSIQRILACQHLLLYPFSTHSGQNLYVLDPILRKRHIQLPHNPANPPSPSETNAHSQDPQAKYSSPSLQPSSPHNSPATAPSRQEISNTAAS